jgi:hypothetical protein
LQPNCIGYTPHLWPFRIRLWHGRHCPTFASDQNSRWRLPFPVSMAAILNFGSRPVSDDVDRDIRVSNMAENMAVDVGIGVRWKVRQVKSPTVWQESMPKPL